MGSYRGQKEEPAKNELPEYDPKCYLCPRNSRAAAVDTNPDYKQTFTFVNDYSAVKESQAPYDPPQAASADGDDPAALLLRAESVTGKCYVVTFSPSHNVTLADMSSAEVMSVVETWTRLYASHVVDPSSPLYEQAAKVHSALPPPDIPLPAPSVKQLRYMQIFENKGAAMGCSNPHPHCQAWTTSALPEEPAIELVQQIKYRAEHQGRHLLGDYVKIELAPARVGERLVWQNDLFAVLVPWWAVWPFEVLVVAKREGVRSLLDLDAAHGRMQFAEVLSEVARRYDNLFECSFPYSAGIHQAPLTGTTDEVEASWFHVHFYPPLLRSATVKKFLVGFEMMAEPQRDITPEQAAKRLRDAGGELYRRKLRRDPGALE